MPNLTVSTDEKSQVIDITDRLNEVVAGNGLCHLFLKHTTAALTIADLDPGTDLDHLDAWRAMIPELNYRHPHDPGHVGDHILSATIGVSLTVPVRGGKLDLGTWQRVVLCEFDGPRERAIVLTNS